MIKAQLAAKKTRAMPKYNKSVMGYYLRFFQDKGSRRARQRASKYNSGKFPSSVRRSVAQGYPQPGQQFAHAKWFGQIIIGPCVQRGDFIGFLIADREDNNWCLGSLSQPPGHFDPFDVGQPQIQNDDVGAIIHNCLQSFLPSCRLKDGMTVCGQRNL
jgi:hypothetical protein